MFGAEGFDGNDGGEEQTVKVKKMPGSRGKTIEVDGQTYQPTGDLSKRGMASLTKTNPELQQAIAAKGGKHSHQGDPGVDPGRQQRYHQQDQQLDQQIKRAGGQPRGDGQDGNDDDDGFNQGTKVNRSKMVDQVMSKKNVDRPTAERIVARASR
jgi:general stress protein YciG